MAVTECLQPRMVALEAECAPHSTRRDRLRRVFRDLDVLWDEIGGGEMGGHAYVEKAVARLALDLLTLAERRGELFEEGLAAGLLSTMRQELLKLEDPGGGGHW